MARGRRPLPGTNRGPILGRVEITFMRAWHVRDATMSSGRREATVKISPGTRTFEKIRNPFGVGHWYVLPGTLTGYPDDMFHMYDRPDAGEFQVSIKTVPS